MINLAAALRLSVTHSEIKSMVNRLYILFCYNSTFLVISKCNLNSVEINFRGCIIDSQNDTWTDNYMYTLLNGVTSRNENPIGSILLYKLYSTCGPRTSIIQELLFIFTALKNVLFYNFKTRQHDDSFSRY